MITDLIIFELNPTKKAKQEALDADRCYHFFWGDGLPKEIKNDTRHIGTKIASTKSFERSLWNRFQEALQRASAPDEIRNLHYADTEESRRAIFEEVLLKQRVLTTAAAVCSIHAGCYTDSERKRILSEKWDAFQQKLVNATSTEAQRLEFIPLVF